MKAVHNARVQLLATALNNLGIASLIAGVLAPTVAGRTGDVVHVGLWVVLGVDLIAIAQTVLGELKE